MRYIHVDMHFILLLDKHLNVGELIDKEIRFIFKEGKNENASKKGKWWKLFS